MMFENCCVESRNMGAPVATNVTICQGCQKHPGQHLPWLFHVGICLVSSRWFIMISLSDGQICCPLGFIMRGHHKHVWESLFTKNPLPSRGSPKSTQMMLDMRCWLLLIRCRATTLPLLTRHRASLAQIHCLHISAQQLLSAFDNLTGQ